MLLHRFPLHDLCNGKLCRINELINERINERINELINELINERIKSAGFPVA